MFKLLGAVQSFVLLLSTVSHAEPAPSKTEATQLSGKDVVAVPAKQPELQGTEGRYYSDNFVPLRDDVRAFERDPNNRYTYCIRNVATYECLSYSSDGSMRRRQHKATAHGTGFAYQHDGDETRILTNEHVVSWPYVTDPEHRVEDVPLGCKLVSQKLQIVDNENDEYEADDIPLTRVVDDRALDVAVVRAKSKLRLLPYRIGRALALSPGDVIIVRGFPLGAFAAYNTGKVINTLDEDRYKHWDHADFIVDAQLSSGNSGSPVLALNRKTGEYELVGVFHASYVSASSLNAVIAIEQLSELMFQLKRTSRAQAALGGEPLTDSAKRLNLQKALAEKNVVPYIGLGGLLIRLHAVEDKLLFEIFSKSFPLDDQRTALILDSAAPDGSGKLQQVWFGSDRGYRGYAIADLDADSAGSLKRVLQRLYDLSSSTLAYRAILSHVPDSRQEVQRRAALQRVLSRAASQDGELAQQLMDLAQDKSPASTDQALPLAEVFSQATLPVSVALTPTEQTKPH